MPRTLTPLRGIRLSRFFASSYTHAVKALPALKSADQR